MKKDTTLVGCLVLLLIVVAIACNLFLMPFLLMIALGAFEIKLSYFVCFAIWLVLSALLAKLKPTVKTK